MKRPQAAGKRYSFEAELENWVAGMDYCAVRVPAKITKALGTTGPVLVMAQVNDSEPFQVSLFPVGGGQHYIRIKASIRKKTTTKVGDRIRLRFMTLDRGNVAIPEDLIEMLASEGLVEAFTAIPPGTRNFIVRRIEEAAKPATREKRVREGVLAALQRRGKMKDRKRTS